MKHPFFILLLILTACTSEDENASEPMEQDVPAFYRGMDLSFTPENIESSVALKDRDGNDIDNTYRFLADAGVNLVRVRLWVDDPAHPYGLENLKRQAREIDNAGMQLLLDFHYSDTWADPGNQQIPAAWQGLNQDALVERIRSYTTNVLQELNQQGTPPAIVQIGNETNNGMLWPIGRIYDNGNEDWSNYVELTRAAVQATRIHAPDAEIMIHHAGIDGANYFYNKLNEYAVDYDMIGLSYYPWWHGDNLAEFETNLRNLALDHTGKRLMIVETAYPHTLDWDDQLNNIIGLPSQVAPGYPATPDGQAAFLNRIRRAVETLPSDQGAGFCYWAPDWVAYPGNETSFMAGSSWENLAVFSFDHEVLPVIEAFRN